MARYRPLVAGWNQCRISSCLVVNNCSIIPGRFFLIEMHMRVRRILEPMELAGNLMEDLNFFLLLLGFYIYPKSGPGEGPEKGQ